MEFADSSSSDIHAKNLLPPIGYSIPVINQFISGSLFSHPRLFIIMGHAQSYKTSIAVELLTSYTSFENLDCEAVWLDCDLKFPIDLLKARKVNLDKLKVAQCRSSEEIIFDLLSIENQIQESENSSSLRAIVIDTLSSSFWIDYASSKLSCYNRYNLKDIVEQFVTFHGITMIVIMEDLPFDPWKDLENKPVMKLRCSSKVPGKGQIICTNIETSESFSQDFSVYEDRSFKWGDINRILPNPDETKEEETKNNDND